MSKKRRSAEPRFVRTNKPVDHQIGANIRRIRTTLGISQQTLAKSLMVTFQQVQKYEKGTNRVNPMVALRCCKLFGVTLDQLFEGAAELVDVKHPFPLREESPPLFDKAATIAAGALMRLPNKQRRPLQQLIKAALDDRHAL